MEALFNELSVYPLGNEAGKQERINAFLMLVKKAGDEGYKAIRCHDNGTSSVRFTEDYTLSDYIYENPRDNKRILLLSVIKKPCFKRDSVEEWRYLKGEFYAQVPKSDTEFVERKSIGLAAAYLRGLFALNLKSAPYWWDNKYATLRIVDDDEPKQAQVLTLSDAEDFNSVEYQDWIVNNTAPEWQDCGIAPVDKKCNLSSTHHGNKELKEFAKKSLFPLDFVVEISTSLEYAPYCKTFVKTIHPETATIDIVLYWKEKGYSMAVKTTSTNEIELRQMAIFLEKRFGNIK